MNVNRDSLPIYLYSTKYYTLYDERKANPFTINTIAKIDTYSFKAAVRYGKIKCYKGRISRLMEKITIEEISTSKYKEERICIGE